MDYKLSPAWWQRLLNKSDVFSDFLLGEWQLSLSQPLETRFVGILL